VAGIDVLLKMTAAAVSQNPSSGVGKGYSASQEAGRFDEKLSDAVRQGTQDGHGARNRSDAPASNGAASNAGAGNAGGESTSGGPESRGVAQGPGAAAEANLTCERDREERVDEAAAVAAEAVAAANAPPVAADSPSSDGQALANRPDVATETAVVPLAVLPAGATLAAPAGLAAMVSDAVATPVSVPVGGGEGAIDVSSLAGMLVEQLPAPPEAAVAVELPQEALPVADDAVVVDGGPTVSVLAEIADVVVEPVVTGAVAGGDEVPVVDEAAGPDVVEPTVSEVNGKTVEAARVKESVVVVAASSKSAVAGSIPVAEGNVAGAGEQVPVVTDGAKVAQVKPGPVVTAGPVLVAVSETVDAGAEPVVAEDAVVVDAKSAARTSVAATIPAGPNGLLTGLWNGVGVSLPATTSNGSDEAVPVEQTDAAGSDGLGGDWGQLVGGDPTQGMLGAGSAVGARPDGGKGIGVGSVGGGTPVGGVKPAVEPVLDQVMSGVLTSHRGGQEVRLRLNPPELGALLIDVAVKDGVVTARLETTQAGTQQLLSDNLSQLRDALAQQGLVVEKIDVSMGDSRMDNSRGEGSSQGMAFADSRGREERSGAGGFDPNGDLAAEPAAKATVPQPRFLRSGQSAGLDVEV
jgi:flagellar hook-length control protein FliK